MQIENIKVIGFDLDHTLYPKSEEINKAIQEYIIRKIQTVKKWSYEQAKEEWTKLYIQLESGRKVLELLEVPNGAEIVQEALENPSILTYLNPHEKVSIFLEKLTKKYILDIITGSNKELTLKKLKKLEIDTKLFNNIICNEYSKLDGSAYTYWLSLYPQLQPNNFIYVGDRFTVDIARAKDFGIKGILVNNKIKKELDCLQFENVWECEQVF